MSDSARSGQQLVLKICAKERLSVYLQSLRAFNCFPGGWDGKESACNAGDLGLMPGSGRSPGEGNGNPLQYFCLENSTVRGAWQATVHGLARVGHDLATKPPPDTECPAHLPEGPKLLVPIPALPISGCGTSCECHNFFFFFIEVNLTCWCCCC